MSAEDANVFECGICAEDHTISSSNCIRMTDAEEDRICRECFEGSVIDGFRQAINNPIEYPYYWGEQAIYLQNFRNHIPDAVWSELTAAYEARKEELETPMTQRLYCRLCGAFASKRSSGGNTQCPGCSQQICAECGQSSGPHNCDDETDENLKGLQRGKHYQRCPGCRAPHQLADGCNHIVCPCRTNYCFICGREAHPDSGHWSAGNLCPRYNQPGTENAQYDHPRAAEYARWEEEYAPDEHDFFLRRHVRRTRRDLRAIRATVEEEDLADRRPRIALRERLLLVIDSLIVEIGILDFEERFDAYIHDEDDASRSEEIERAWHDPQLRNLLTALPVLENAVRDVLAMEVDHDHRAYIVEDVRASL